MNWSRIAEVEPTLLFVLRSAARTAFNRANARLKKTTDISLEQLAVLAFVSNHAGCAQQHVARGLFLDKSSVSEALERLADAGLIERREEEQDRRILSVFETERGKRVRQRVEPILHHAVAELASGLGFRERELSIVQRFLTAVVDQANRAAAE